MDANEYPTDDELTRITTWPYTDFMGLMDYVESHCWSSYGSFNRQGREFRLITGGWSGNEEVVRALERNAMFGAVCWQSSHRGGLHVYKVPVVANASGENDG